MSPFEYLRHMLDEASLKKSPHQSAEITGDTLAR